MNAVFFIYAVAPLLPNINFQRYESDQKTRSCLRSPLRLRYQHQVFVEFPTKDRNRFAELIINKRDIDTILSPLYNIKKYIFLSGQVLWQRNLSHLFCRNR